MLSTAEYNARLRQAAFLLNMERAQHWTKRVSEYPDAIVAPQLNRWRNHEFPLGPEGMNRDLYDGGVYTKRGRIVADAIHVGGAHRHVPAPFEQVEPVAERLPGRWLFGGFLRGHFGHFLTESLGRLWALRDDREVEGVLFLNYNGNPPPAEGFSTAMLMRRGAGVLDRRFVQDTLALLTKGVPVRSVNAPTEVESLVVPSQLIGNVAEADFIAGHGAFRDFVAGRLKVPRDSDTRRVYISRSALPLGSSSFLGELIFERELAKQGYEIVHPERLSIAEQVKVLATAEKVIVGTGSAVHLLALATHSNQDIALLGREFATPPKFYAQLRGSDARSVLWIDRVIARLRPLHREDDARVNWRPQNAMHLLDFNQVLIDLAEADFVAEAAPLDLLQDAIDQQVAEVSGRQENIAFRLEKRPQVAVSKHVSQVDWPVECLVGGHLEMLDE